MSTVVLHIIGKLLAVCMQLQVMFYGAGWFQTDCWKMEPLTEREEAVARGLLVMSRGAYFVS